MTSQNRQDLIKLLGSEFKRTKIKSGTSPDAPKQYRLAPYRVWESMKNECVNPKSPNYSKVGALGITYVADWEVFINFWNSTKHGWVPGAKLKRRDETKAHSPKNTYWQPPLGVPEFKRAKCKTGVWGLVLWRTHVDADSTSWRVRLTDKDTGKRVSKFWAIRKYGEVYGYMLARTYMWETVLKPKQPVVIDPTYKPF